MTFPLQHGNKTLKVFILEKYQAGITKGV